MTSIYEDGLTGDARERYKTKLVAAGIHCCPYEMGKELWTNDPKQWPDVQYPDIYSYLVDSPGVFTKESMKNYRSLEAHNYFISGWVNTINHFKTPSGLFLLKADVKPSQRLNDKPHHPWVAVHKNGTVTAAHCDCMAGLGESCSHVAALLFKIEAAVRMGYTKYVSTDQLCQWNQCFIKKVQPAPISRIVFYKDQSKKKLREAQHAKVDNCIRASKAQKHDFLCTLAKKSPKCVGLSNFKEFKDPFLPCSSASQLPKLPSNLRSLFQPQVTDFNKLRADALQRVYDVTEEQREFLIRSTLEQSDTPAWHEMRIGRVTASRVHPVLHSNFENPAPSVIKSICMPPCNISHLPAIQWGIAKETEATHDYTMHHSMTHDELQVTKTGFWLDKEYPFIGASPDGLINCKSCGFGVLEVKCPYKYKDCESQDTILNDTAGCLDESGQLKKNHPYYSQVQTQMMVCEATYADFVLWTPNIFIVNRVLFDQVFVDNLRSVVPSFWIQYCLPELLTRSLEQGTA